MKELKLNYFPLQVFGVKDIDGIKKFFSDYPSEEYIFRNTDKAKGNFCFVKSEDEIEKALENFDNQVTVGVSYNPFKNNIVLVGDIKVEKKNDSVTIQLTARSDKKATHRNIYEKPKYNLSCNIEDDRLWQIDGFDKAINYIVKHDLFGCIVEFTVYDIAIGINHENVVISEIRTLY